MAWTSVGGKIFPDYIRKACHTIRIGEGEHLSRKSDKWHDKRVWPCEIEAVVEIAKEAVDRPFASSIT